MVPRYLLTKSAESPRNKGHISNKPNKTHSNPKKKKKKSSIKKKLFSSSLRKKVKKFIQNRSINK